MRKLSKPPRCNYCKRSSVVVIRWRSSLASMGRRRVFMITAGACAEHEDCVNFKSVRGLHPDAPEQRFANRREGTEG